MMKIVKSLIRQKIILQEEIRELFSFKDNYVNKSN